MIGTTMTLPHEHDAVLLDRVWAVTGELTRAVATVRAETPFGATPQGWPDWLLIELMAQTVAGGAGIREFVPGTRPQLGLLLGVRNFSCRTPLFAPGIELQLEAAESSRDEFGMGVFDCSIDVDGRRAASATLSVYLPAQVDDYLESLES